MRHLHVVNEAEVTILEMRADAHRRFLNSYQEGESRRSMKGALDRVAMTFSGGSLSGETFPWEVLVDGSLTWDVLIPTFEHFHPGTAQRDTSAVRKMLKCCWRVGLLNFEEFSAACDFDLPRIPAQTKRRTQVCAEDIEMLVRIPQGGINQTRQARDEALILSIASSGARRSEITYVDIQDSKWDDGYLWLPVTKTNVARPAWLHPHAVEANRRWIERRSDADGALFTPLSRTCRPLIERRMSSHQVWAIIRGRAISVGLDWITPHDLRRYAVTALLEAGHDLLLVARIVGHRSVQSTARYDIRSDIASRKAIASIQIPKPSSD